MAAQFPRFAHKLMNRLIWVTAMYLVSENERLNSLKVFESFGVFTETTVQVTRVENLALQSETTTIFASGEEKYEKREKMREKLAPAKRRQTKNAEIYSSLTYADVHTYKIVSSMLLFYWTFSIVQGWVLTKISDGTFLLLVIKLR